MRDEAFAAWRRSVFESLADGAPLVSSSRTSTGPTSTCLEFVDYLVDWAAGVPLLVICTARRSSSPAARTGAGESRTH